MRKNRSLNNSAGKVESVLLCKKKNLDTDLTHLKESKKQKMDHRFKHKIENYKNSKENTGEYHIDHRFDDASDI